MGWPLVSIGKGKPSVTFITEEDAHDAFISYASSRCCYGPAPARDGVITSLKPLSTYKVSLWMRVTNVLQRYGISKPQHRLSLRIKRSTLECRIPPLSRPAMSVWGKETPDAHTVQAQTFYISGGVEGSSNGYFGAVICVRCSGNGFCECEKCQGKKKLLFFNKLQIKWTTDRNELLVQRGSMKSEKLWKVSGRTIFANSQSKLSPLVDFPDPSINQASKRLIQEHQSKYFQTSRILQQRHIIELIPVTKVSYTWKEKSYDYIVFGNENRVYTDNYPAKCCCSVM
ncbi:protein SSUH2 homolog [Clarias gariepinus]|uniref:protein SSUH2 homolog n=1 Tax=Clarias gariepinus TaxID=13013 RepID=UPI00234D884E|nr:protein SSUH2 homolog [Clarias gariepinus]